MKKTTEEKILETLEEILETIQHLDMEFTNLKKDTNAMIDKAADDFLKQQELKAKTVPKGWDLLSLKYDRSRNIAFLDCHETDIDPKFLHYLLESQHIPTDAKIVYNRD